MAFIGQFNANDVEPNAPAEILPAGKYLMQISNSEMRETKKGGQLLWLELTVVDGQYTNRKAFDRLNLINDNPKAVEIAQRQLSAICHATGQLSVSDSDQLHHRTMLVTVKVKPADGQYNASNEIGGYEPAGGATRAAAPSARPATGGIANDVSRAEAAMPAKAAATPPWRRAAG